MEPLLSIDEAAAILKMSKKALYSYVKNKQVPAFKFGRRIKFQKAALERWVAQHMEESNKPIKQ